MKFPLNRWSSRARTATGDRFTIILREHEDRSWGWTIEVNGLVSDDRSENWIGSGIEMTRFLAFQAALAALGVISRKEIL